jgi:2-dehydropantoate 2-reductase
VTGAIHGTFRLTADERLPPEFGPEAILWTVKAFDLASSAPTLVAGAPAPTPTLLPQNGLGIEPRAAEALRAAGWAAPEPALVRAVSSVPATFVAPGKVRAAGRGELTLPVPAGPNAIATRRLTQLLTSAGITVRVSADLPRDVWRKAVLNAAINPVTALHGVANGRLAEPALRTEALELLHEARSAAAAAGFAFAEAELTAEFDRVVSSTADNRSSMLQDLDRGRPTEVDAISGEVLEAGARAGLDLPATRRAVDEVRARARHPLPRSATE